MKSKFFPILILIILAIANPAFANASKEITGYIFHLGEGRISILDRGFLMHFEEVDNLDLYALPLLAAWEQRRRVRVVITTKKPAGSKKTRVISYLELIGKPLEP